MEQECTLAQNAYRTKLLATSLKQSNSCDKNLYHRKNALIARISGENEALKKIEILLLSQESVGARTFWFQCYSHVVKDTPVNTRVPPKSRVGVSCSFSNRPARSTADTGTKLIKTPALAGPTARRPS